MPFNNVVPLPSGSAASNHCASDEYWAGGAADSEGDGTKDNLGGEEIVAEAVDVALSVDEPDNDILAVTVPVNEALSVGVPDVDTLAVAMNDSDALPDGVALDVPEGDTLPAATNDAEVLADDVHVNEPDGETQAL